MQIKLPYPNKDLMPNRKNGKHWGATVEKKNDAFAEAFYLTKEVAGTKKLDGKIEIRLTFVQDDKRHRDLDNLLAAAKSMLDGVAHALGIDDKNFEPITIMRRYDTSRYTLLDIVEDL